MRTALVRFRDVYGSHPLHLLTLIAGFALFAYVLATVKPATLWNTNTWWQSIAVWFAVAIIAHDLVLFPLYALIDRILSSAGRIRPRRRDTAVPVLNYVRVPALGAGLMLLVFLPGIIEQGAFTYQAATGQTQEPFLGRWLLLTAAMFATAAVVYAVRLTMARRARPPSG
jgi:energy-converting hydrogenase Eha subunit E